MILRLLETVLGTGARLLSATYDSLFNLKKLRSELAKANTRIIQLESKLVYLEHSSQAQRQLNLVLARRETARLGLQRDRDKS